MAAIYPSMIEERKRPVHKRSTSSVLRSIINPLGHKRTPSNGVVLANHAFDENYGVENLRLQDEHPSTSVSQSENLPLSEIKQNQGSPRKHKEQQSGSTKSGLHSRTLSTVSLASISARSENEKKTRARSKTASDEQKPKTKQPKKPKSQTGLAALFSRPKSSRSQKSFADSNDKENQAPSAGSSDNPPPIWAQFASQKRENSLKDEFPSLAVTDQVQNEISRYTPTEYSQSQQRNFNDLYQPSLSRRPSAARKPSSNAERPYSMQISASSSSASFREALQDVRRNSSDRVHPSVSAQQAPIGSRKVSRDSNSSSSQQSSRSSSLDAGAPLTSAMPEKLTVAKRGSRVMAAVAAFNSKAKESGAPTKPNGKSIDEAFEQLLDSRNVPLHTRQKMRALDSSLKADLLKQDKLETKTDPASSELSQVSIVNRPTSRGLPLGNGSPEKSQQEQNLQNGKAPASPGKRSRPLSKNFSFHKSDRDGSPSKRLKSSDHSTDENVNPLESTKSPGHSSTRRAFTSGLGSRNHAAMPGEFVAYLRKVKAPTLVEVEKLHKLRLVLRNERVEWVDNFINAGGMTEIIGLLHRTMELEWREDHEDQLLHETLLCLKALCTTAVALKELVQVQKKLFPALIGMLFDDERKGPSEYTTRGVVITIIYTYLAFAPQHEKAERAQILLSYLQDPRPSADAHDFIYSMHESRPYRVWCKEVTNVTKEVFWIFLHAVNVIPIESPAHDDDYSKMHFPRERPPVAAAPYVGGVEWDATNYLANHIDLMNAIIASIPTKPERNALRAELRASGFEKIMGSQLRTCKEKFYGAVHDVLKTWIAAALDDGWDYKEVRNGPSAVKYSPKKSKAAAPAPKLDLPKLDLGVEKRASKVEVEDVWL